MILQSMFLDLVVPRIHELLARAQRLSLAINALAATPTSEHFQRAEAEWRATAVAWKRAVAFREGPIVESDAVFSNYWPSNPSWIEKVLTGNRMIDTALLSDLGVGAKGVYALEYLLFRVGGAERWEQNQRVRGYAIALAQDLVRVASQAVRALGTGGRFATQLAHDGPDGISRIVELLVANVENVAVRLGAVVDRSRVARPDPQTIEGGPSGTSHALLEALLSETERLYRGGKGGSIAALVLSRAPPIHAHVEDAWRSARSSFAAFPEPIEEAAAMKRTELAHASESVRVLERMLKVDVAAALGTTLTFHSLDGD